MNRQYTDHQTRAIQAQGHNILVAASAGSGKTTVLIERILRRILAGQNIDEFLIVTFTNAAAAEVKARLEAALQQELTISEGAVRQHLYWQLTLLPVANISTIDAYALKLIESYYYKIGLDPRFRLLSDAAERQMLRQDSIDNVFSQYYDKAHPQHANFLALVNNFGSPNHDHGLKEEILRLAEFAQARPHAQAWLAELAQTQTDQGGDLLASQPLGTHVRQLFLTEIQQAQQQLRPILNEVGEMPGLQKTYEGLATLAEYLTTLSATFEGGWDTVQAYLAEWPKIGLDRSNSTAVRDSEERRALVKRAAQVKNSIIGSKAPLNELADTYFGLNARQWRLVNHRGQELVKMLVTVTESFNSVFAERKRNDNLLDFADLEIFALEILAEDDTRALIASQFSEILIDEYQDINQLQESLLQQLSNGHNLYMVGDVKQSIYGFRQADPTLFSQKYRDFADAVTHDERIELADNFRSQRNVTQITNLIFTQLMDRELGDIPYQDEARLVARAHYPTELPAIFNIDIIQQAGKGSTSSDEPDDGPDWQKREGQYAHLIEKIRTLRDSGTIFDPKQGENGASRPVRYSDIAILTRSKGGYIDLVRMLHEADMPVQVDGVGDYFQTMEIYIMLDTLRVIDNPHQDIPLVAMLRSPMFELNENDLAAIRLQDREHDYWTALMTDAKNNPNSARIVAQIQRWQSIARQNDLVGLMLAIYEDTGWLDYMGGMVGGPQRQANLHALYQYAANYQENQHTGLFRFIRYVEELQKNGGQLGEVTQESDQEAIRVMTIHASKGLEFPIVFLPEFEKSFNITDLKGNMLIQKDAGLGLDYVEPHAQVIIPTLAKLLVKDALKRQNWSEEMRLLYVALTRAKQQLYVIGTVKVDDSGTNTRLSDLWQNASESTTQFLPSSLRLKANSYLEWLLISLARTQPVELTQWLGSVEHPGQLGLQTPRDGQIQVQLIPEDQIQLNNQVAEASATDAEGQGVGYTAADYTKAQAILDYHYGNVAGTQTAAYQSVTEIKRLFEDPDRATMATLSIDESGTVTKANTLTKSNLPFPNFMMNGSQKPSSSAIGTATHLLLQSLDFGNYYSQNELQALCDQLVERGQLLAPVAALINIDDILAFLASPFGQKISQHQAYLHREATFAMIMPANQIYQGLTDHNPVLIHGIIDGYFLDESRKAITLFDYKTDYVRTGKRLNEDLAHLKHRYAGQLRLYRRALEEEYPDYQVTETVLIALNAGQIVMID